ncbi:hypothetical protein EEB13_27720 [Rhodococcus sp. WS3]|uniref:DUF6361 family protein n=1 Tax=Rhodococcus sp. WS3 TaxID=2486271 RepID=UPI001144FF29|nr:hypothetical protein EEB13_27720 [Rhodococcus sp. WS3]
MRELVALFSEPGTLDNLGIGQLRDGLADLLFPGISTVQTRARYLVLIPWTYQRAALRKSGAALVKAADREQREMLLALREAGHTQGLIGRVAGAAVRVLPSAIYWNALQTYKILRQDTRPQHLLQIRKASANDDEMRDVSPWSTLPLPESFPTDVTEQGFDLSTAEANWLRERMVVTCEGSLLAYLLSQPTMTDLDVDYFWDLDLDGAPQELRDLVEDTELFSLTLHGASLLYNLMVGEAYEHHELTSVEAPAQHYRDELAQWSDRYWNHPLAPTWDRSRLWNRFPALPPRTQQFVETWIDGINDLGARTPADSVDLRKLISDREFQNKGAQSRLTNEKQLRLWQGASGASRLQFRWPQASQILSDISEGLKNARA